MKLKKRNFQTYIYRFKRRNMRYRKPIWVLLLFDTRFQYLVQWTGMDTLWYLTSIPSWFWILTFTDIYTVGGLTEYVEEIFLTFYFSSLLTFQVVNQFYAKPRHCKHYPILLGFFVRDHFKIFPHLCWTFRFSSDSQIFPLQSK